MNKGLIFDISHLADAPIGSRETYSFSTPASLEFVDLKSDIAGKVEFMRIEDGFNVKLEEIELKAVLECQRCLKKYPKKIKFPFAERVFWIDKPRQIEDPNDLYLIDKKNLKIDISEMLRQEIILHLPINPVCSKSCEVKYKNEAEESSQNKPLKGLKDLLK